MSSRVASEPTSITFASMEEGDSSGGASTSLQLTLGQPTSLSTLVPAGSAATCCPTAPVSAPVYVLSADGSRLWLLDSSRKPLNEEPPAYPTQGRPRSATSTTPRPARQIGIRSFSTPHLQDSSWRSILYGDGADDQEVNERTPLLAPARDSQWKRYWRPIFQRKYWRPLFHLLFINLPLNLLVWPLLLVGSLVGTALLITLPIGAVVWWLTLIIARWAAREELRLQHWFHYHGSQAHPHAVFYRLREVQDPEGDDEFVWDTRFLRCSLDMFCDYYSYSAVVYFLLIKPLVVFFPTVALIALFPVCLVLFPLLPVYLRVARRYGLWQARVALDNV